MPDFLALVTEQESVNSRLLKRMDEDKKLQYLDKYIMLDKDGLPVPNMINITLPDTAIFSANILAALGSATERIIVTSEDKGLDTAFIEDFQRAAFASANDRRRRQGLPPINSFTDEQVSIRGRTAHRVLFRMEEGTLVPDITPWDTRFVTYDFGVEGLKWAAYKTMRSKGAIMAEYGIDIKVKSALVVDVWHTEGNEVWIAGKKVIEQEHKFEFTPVAVQVVSLGSMLADTDAIEHIGESLFFLIRDLIPELNRLVSIAQTINFKMAKGSYVYKNTEGKSGEPPDPEDLNAISSVTSIGTTEEIDPLLIQDVQRAFIELNRILEGRLQRGSLSNIDLGVLGNQPPSGVTLLQVKADRDKVFRPRIEAKSLVNESIAEMFTKQCIQIGGTVELGVPGQKRKFNTSKLTAEYQTEYKYFVKSPELDAGALTLASAAGRLLPDRVKRREILQREDPDEDEQWLAWENAALLSPAVRINRTVRQLLELADKGVEGAEIEAEIMSAEMGVTVQQMLAGEAETPKPEEEQEPRQVIPLLGQQGISSAPEQGGEGAT